MSTGPKTSWGGVRPNSGRKKETLSGRQVQAMLDKASEYEKETGKSLDDILLMIIYGEKFQGERVPLKDKLASIKLYKEYTMAKLAEGGDIDSQIEMPVWLPEKKQDPAKLVKLDDHRDKDDVETP